MAKDYTNEFTPLQKQWIFDLMFGDQKQVTHRLGDKEEGRCCLGVVRDTAGWNESDVVGALDEEHQMELFLRTPEGGFVGHHAIESCNALTGLNDRLRWSFKQIGQFMLDNPWIVFTNFTKPEGK